MHRHALGGALVALALAAALAMGGRAAVTLRAESTLTLGVAPVPVTFAEGDATSNSRFVKDFALTSNKTGFGGTLKAKSGAYTVVTDLVRVRNDGAQAEQATFRASPVSNANYELFRWVVRDGATVVTTFDYMAALPTATLTVPAGAEYRMDLHVDLVEGAGRHNAGVPFGLVVEVAT